MVLLYPVPTFRRHLELFDRVTDGSAIWKSLLLQVACEFATDTICLVVETRKGTDPSALYRRLPKDRAPARFLPRRRLRLHLGLVPQLLRRSSDGMQKPGSVRVRRQGAEAGQHEAGLLPAPLAQQLGNSDVT